MRRAVGKVADRLEAEIIDARDLATRGDRRPARRPGCGPHRIRGSDVDIPDPRPDHGDRRARRQHRLRRCPDCEEAPASRTTTGSASPVEPDDLRLRIGGTAAPPKHLPSRSDGRRRAPALRGLSRSADRLPHPPGHDRPRASSSPSRRADDPLHPLRRYSRSRRSTAGRSSTTPRDDGRRRARLLRASNRAENLMMVSHVADDDFILFTHIPASRVGGAALKALSSQLEVFLRERIEEQHGEDTPRSAGSTGPRHLPQHQDPDRAADLPWDPRGRRRRARRRGVGTHPQGRRPQGDAPRGRRLHGVPPDHRRAHRGDLRLRGPRPRDPSLAAFARGPLPGRRGGQSHLGAQPPPPEARRPGDPAPPRGGAVPIPQRRPPRLRRPCLPRPQRRGPRRRRPRQDRPRDHRAHRDQGLSSLPGLPRRLPRARLPFRCRRRRQRLRRPRLHRQPRTRLHQARHLADLNIDSTSSSKTSSRPSSASRRDRAPRSWPRGRAARVRDRPGPRRAPDPGVPLPQAAAGPAQ